jgi:uncharacterized membrane protein YcaP (DUF421 family)
MNTEISYIQIIIETIITFFVLLILTRFLGKKQLSHLTFFNYVTGITIGSIAANMVFHNTNEYLKELTSITLWCVLTIVIGYIGLKSGKMRVVLDGQPTILVKKGIIDKKALLSSKLNIDDLTMLLRQKNVFSITEIDYAILEPNGTLSVLVKPQFQNTQKKDLQINEELPRYIPTEIIVDGKLLIQNLKELGILEEWINTELMNANINSIKEVFYAEIQPDGKLYIQKND